MFKVLYITGMHATKYGGLEKFNISLMKQGVDLSLVYKSQPLSDVYVSALKNEKARMYCVDGSPFVKLLRLYKIIAHDKPDIIHYHFGGAYMYMAPIFSKVFPSIKQVLTLHCEVFITHRIQKWLMSNAFKYLQRVISVSNGVENGLTKEFGRSNKFIVSYLGVEPNIQNLTSDLRQTLNIAEDDFVILSVGWDVQIKGFDVLIKSIAHIVNIQHNLQIKVVLVGLNEVEDEKLRSLVEREGLVDYVVSVGIRNDIDNYYAIADLYVQSSRTEAISLSIMEALSFGIPIVGSRIGGIPEVCLEGYNGFLFDSENSIELGREILKLINDKTLRIAMGNNSLQLARQFNRDCAVKNLVKIYKELV